MSLSAAIAAVVIQAQLIAPQPRIPLPRPSATAVRATINHNRASAGVLKNGVLTIAIDALQSAWRPEGDTDPEVPVLAFAERGRSPQVPGPLIRVPQGTEVRLVIRNRADTSLVIGGLRPAVSTALDTIQLARGATRVLRYQLTAPGTYFYWGSLAGTMWADRLWLDSQLNGAIVVDPPGGSPPDHILLITEWFHPYEERPFEVVATINGKAWPHTERLTLRQGDSTTFRVINTIALFHPMHLHGFYYRVKARGDWARDGPLAPEMQPLINTDLLAPGGTLTLAFAPTTPGNWVFHCHFASHVDETVTLTGSPRDSAEAGSLAKAKHSHAEKEPSTKEHNMRGLVIGLHVTPSADYREQKVTNARNIRLLVQKKPRRLITDATAYGFVVQDSALPPARDSVRLPGPVLELERGKPVRINVVNNLDEPTGIHWHGLEIESFPDGVANFSGMGAHIFPPVAQSDSFVAEFTPPRAGTFLYHSHLSERHQIQSGMYGALVVSDTKRDPERDHIIIAGGGGPELQAKVESPFALVNGQRFPRPLRLTAGETHRLRIISIHPDWRIAFTLRNDSTVARWRAIAKDGADLPPPQATERAAHVEMGPGETADFTFTPSAPGEWRVEVKSVESGWYIPLTIIVADKPREQGRP